MYRSVIKSRSRFLVYIYVVDLPERVVEGAGMASHVLFTRGSEEVALIGYTPDITGVSTAEVLWYDYARVSKFMLAYLLLVRLTVLIARLMLKK
jgi:hypothetical protein